MNTETVLQIIAMLDVRITECNNFINSSSLDNSQWRYIEGTLFGLQELRDHLQGFIEAEVNYAENALQGGE